MEIFGFIGAFLMGLTLGLIGGGGSILTVPILVYIFSIDSILATAYSLFIVGITSLVGSFSHIYQKNIHWRTAFVFGVPSILSVYFTRSYLLPILPQNIVVLGDFIITKSILILIVFAIVMIVASFIMIKEKPKVELIINEDIRYNYSLILLEGIIVGMITGFVGAGGGFLIIPALVLFAKLSMKKAIGTSLVIIALKSLLGFLGDLKTNQILNWQFLFLFSILAIIGILVGSYLSKKVDENKLKPAFGFFVLIMGCLILIKELLFQNV